MEKKMERRAFIIGLLGMIFGVLLWLIQGLSHGGISPTTRWNVKIVIFFVGLALDLLGIILGVRAGRSNAAIGGIGGGLMGLMLLGLVVFIIAAEIASSTPR